MGDNDLIDVWNKSSSAYSTIIVKNIKPEHHNIFVDDIEHRVIYARRLDEDKSINYSS